MTLSSHPETILLSFVNWTDDTSEGCSISFNTSQFLVSHTLSLQSNDPEASLWPSLLKETDLTQPLWACISFTMLPSATSWIIIVPCVPEAIFKPSLLSARQRTLTACPAKVRVSRPSYSLNYLICPSSHAVKTVSPFWEKTKARTESEWASSYKSSPEEAE